MWRYRDKRKQGKLPNNLSEKKFVDWYVSQKDECTYCRTPYSDLKVLQLDHFGGKYVSWDIDRKNNVNRTYVLSNIVLSCFICNTAKGSWFTENQARAIGKTIRQVFKEMLLLKNSA